MKAYDAKDYVEVVGEDGNPIDGFAHPVPKQWIGTDLLPPGAKAADAEGDVDEDGSQDSPEPFDPTAHKQDEVLAYLADAEPDEVERVKAAEAEGDDRKGIAAFEPAVSSGEDNKTESEGS